jgi:general stress protein 26
MGDHKDLENEFAVDKIKDLAENIKTCMFCTYNDIRLQSRPMSVQKIDDYGQLWFLSEPHDKFLTLHGTATILYDRDKIEELYSPIVKVWMPGGIDDPNLSVIKVTPEDGYYWNNKNGKMVAIAKMTAALVTGKTMDDGIEGSLKL